MTNMIFAGSRHAGTSRVAQMIRTAGAAEHAESAALAAVNGDLRQQLAGAPPAPELQARAAAALGNGAAGLNLWADDGTAAALDFWAGIGEDTRYVLVFVPPEVELAAFIAGAAEQAKSLVLDELLQCWSRTTLAMLDLLARRPDAALMINARSALLAPRTLVSKLNRTWGLDLAQPEGPLDEDRSSAAEQVAHAVCRAWIEHNHPDICAIAAEARVRALDLIPADVENTPTVDLAMLRQVQQLAAELREQQTRMESDARERSALLASLEQAAAERDAHAASLTTATSERRLAVRFIEQLEDEVIRVHRKLALQERQARDLAANQSKRAAIDLVGELRSLQR